MIFCTIALVVFVLCFRRRKSIIRFALRVSDGGVALLNQWVNLVLVEVFRLGSQALNALSTLLLRIVHKDEYNKLREQGRIHKKPRRRPTKGAGGMSPLGLLFKFDAREQQPDSPINGGTEVPSATVHSFRKHPKGVWLFVDRVERLAKLHPVILFPVFVLTILRRIAGHFFRRYKGFRAQRGDDEVVSHGAIDTAWASVPERDEVFESEVMTTGLIEELQLRVLIGSNHFFGWIRQRILHRLFGVLENLTLGSLLLAPYDVLMFVLFRRYRKDVREARSHRALAEIGDDSETRGAADVGSRRVSGVARLVDVPRIEIDHPPVRGVDADDSRAASGSAIESVSPAGKRGVLSRVLNPVSNLLSLVVWRGPEVDGDKCDVRGAAEIIDSAGYPFETYVVKTADGYLLDLVRIPRKESRNVVFLQHGVLDSCFAWIADDNGLAFRAWDHGVDVFLGNFRGSLTRGHVKEGVSAEEYWDFSINEYGFQDVPAFIKEIHRIKMKELTLLESKDLVWGLMDTEAVTEKERAEKEVSKQAADVETERDMEMEESSVRRRHKKFEQDSVARESESSTRLTSSRRHSSKARFFLTAVGHSMGAEAILMHLINSKLCRRPTMLSQCILLAPAGYHERYPVWWDVIGPVIELFVAPFFSSFRYPSDMVRYLAARVMQDVRNSPATHKLFQHVMSYGVGSRRSTLDSIPNLTWNLLAGTSVQVYWQFSQQMRQKRFLAYDYGSKERNRAVYQQDAPLDFLDLYRLIDVPVHFLGGTDDYLIPPVNVLKHYSELSRFHPNLAFIKFFPHLGHTDFSLRPDDELNQYVFNILGRLDRKHSDKNSRRRRLSAASARSRSAAWEGGDLGPDLSGSAAAPGSEPGDFSDVDSDTSSDSA